MPRLAEGARARGGPSWAGYRVKDTEKDPVVWEARATRFWPSHKGGCLAACWLVVARHVQTRELKSFLSNASAETSIEALPHVAFTRAEVAQLVEAAKGEMGLDHFEVRHYVPLVRRLTVSMASLSRTRAPPPRMRLETTFHTRPNRAPAGPATLL